MALALVKLIEAQDPERFQSELRAFLRKLEYPEVDMTSIRVSLAVAPGPLYAATVTWLDVEDDLMNAPVLSQSMTVTS